MAMERKTRAKALTGTYLALVAIALVLLNVISFTAYKRFDLTKNERFTLSKGSKHLVAEKLKQPLQIDFYVTRGLPKYEAFIQDVTDLLNEYERASNGKVSYRVIEPKTDEQKKEAKEAGLQEAAFGEGSETGQDQATITRGFMGVAFKYGLEKESIPILSPESAQGLEFWITNKIREIRDRAENEIRKFGVVTGKDEIKIGDPNLVPAQGGRPGPSMKSIMEQALPFYKFEDVDLAGGESEINKELSGLIITQPGKDFTEKELRRIDEFLMQGDKAVAVFASAVNLKAADASMKADLDLHGLDKLLSGYGVEMKKEAALDWGRSMTIPVQTQSGQVLYIRTPGVVQAQHDSRLEEGEQLLDSSFAGFFRLEELSFPFPSPLVVHPEKQPSATVKVVARTTPATSTEAGETIDMKIRPDWEKKPPFAQHPIAVVVEGTLKSAFPGEGEGVKAPAESKAPSRLLVVSSSQFLANPFARAGNPPPLPPQMAMMGGLGGDEDLQMIAQFYAQQYLTATILAFKNTLDWMVGESDLIAASAKLLGETNLTYSDIDPPKLDANASPEEVKREAEQYQNERNRVQRNVQWTLIFLAPALFAGFGLLRWRRRESARERISLD